MNGLEQLICWLEAHPKSNLAIGAFAVVAFLFVPK